MQRALWVQTIAGVQWLGFMFANTVVIPLSVGSAFHQPPEMVAGAMSRSFVVTGIACLVQWLIGHRLPLMEGQSGMWWSVILGLAQLGVASGVPLPVVGGSLSVGIVLGGLLVVIFGVLGLHRWLNRWFSPVVMATLLFLLSSQLISIFFRGMLGMTASGRLIIPVALLSLTVVVLVSALTIAGRGLINHFAILIGLAGGWLAYQLLFGASQRLVVPRWTDIAQGFAWGPAHWQLSMVLTCATTALLNTTNTIATLRAAEPVFQTRIRDVQYRRSLLLSGLFTAVSGPLALVPYAPYTSSIGFLRTTRLLDGTPFAIGAALFTMLGAIPTLSGFFATLPESVGSAVLFVAYLQLFGAALNNLQGIAFDFRTIFRIALPTLLGLAIQNTPSEAFATLPSLLQPLLSNGMLVGIIVSVLLERLPWRRWTQQASKDGS
ncbi:permease [Alicyclobacillus contaminans]|uniref:uracil/xanthine transporter n=1 Tax=Alicyclobacillus contaminans TaxID=392016 RepID=UPI0004089CA6|nr:uracil/xanthine transporter [Alicyclobacillus contaminans]GMA51696.1 permease [Alicyclobacillus contaminans]